MKWFRFVLISKKTKLNYMKKILPITIIAIITGAIAFFIGKSVGFDEAEVFQNNRGIEMIKLDLRNEEIKMMSALLEGKAQIETRNEGTLFRSKYVKYLTGKIQSTALLAKAKDVKVRVTFLSKTNSKIGDVEFTIYEYINPLGSKTFTKKVDLSEDVSEFQWEIIDAKAE